MAGYTSLRERLKPSSQQLPTNRRAFRPAEGFREGRKSPKLVHASTTPKDMTSPRGISKAASFPRSPLRRGAWRKCTLINLRGVEATAAPPEPRSRQPGQQSQLLAK